MNPSLLALSKALKALFGQFKTQQPLSFLILTGRANQGKTSLMRQANFEHHPIDADGAHLYSNQQGIIVELSEAWLNQSSNLLEQTVKQLNSLHSQIKINGLILCIDIDELLKASPADLNPLIKSHAKFLERFGLTLPNPCDTAIVFTKLDLIAGFCDFFQAEHPLDLAKPLGFSLDDSAGLYRPIEQFKSQFDALVMSLGLQVTQKIHPIRSNVKRTLIREFPLQIASLRNLLLSQIGSISSQLFHIKALYFSSSEQGGVIDNRLNDKIQHEFSLAIPDQLPLSTNYRAYFVEGAFSAFQKLTARSVATVNPKQKKLIIGASLSSLACLGVLIGQYFSSSTILAQVAKELQIVTRLNGHPNDEATVYHLSQASKSIESLSPRALALPMIKDLRSSLNQQTNEKLTSQFIPSLLRDIEEQIEQTDASVISRYQALKIYLMLDDAKHYQAHAVIAWFSQHWQSDPSHVKEKIRLLQQLLDDPSHPIQIKQAIVRDAQNYLNALPADFLYYSLAKPQLDSKPISVNFEGFNLASTYIPLYLSQPGFFQTESKLTKIAEQITAEGWILNRPDKADIQKILLEGYAQDYISWWQHFMNHSQPKHTETYAETNQLAQTLRQANSINKFIHLIQSHTKPQNDPKYKHFNEAIASHFASLALISPSSTQHLHALLKELEQFSKTLSLVSDQGQTAFNITKARFEGKELANPISLLSKAAEGFPEPIAAWTQQIANDSWFALIHDSRDYLNHTWKSTVFNDYQAHIAHRFPLDPKESQEINLNRFNQFFAARGSLQRFMEDNIKPFLDTSKAQWVRKEVDHSVMPISDEIINELMRANVISAMFFSNQADKLDIEFSLQKLNLDPLVSELQFDLGQTELLDNQTSESVTQFHWPEANARLILRSIEGKDFQLKESGDWAFFKLLQNLNVMVDEEDSRNLQILFEINGNSGRYLLKAQNQVNPFIPGILEQFYLVDKIV